MVTQTSTRTRKKKAMEGFFAPSPIKKTVTKRRPARKKAMEGVFAPSPIEKTVTKRRPARKKAMEGVSAPSPIKKTVTKRRHGKAPAQDLEKAASSEESDTDFDEEVAVGRITQATDLAEEPDTNLDLDSRYHLAAEDFEIDFKEMQSKMPRFPASLKGLGTSYVAPRVVAIGPYHKPLHSLGNGESDYLMEEVKRVAASHFIKKSGHTFLEIRAKVESVAGDSHKFYNNIGSTIPDDFVNMMCVDGCFLLQYMLICTARDELLPSLLYVFESNQAYISNDIMLLENQLPWVVLDTLWSFMPSVNVREFIAKMGRTLQVSGDKVSKSFAWDGTYKPPHLLGLLWFYKTGGNNVNAESQPEELRPMSKTISAIELAEMGIRLTASKTTKFTDMGIKRRPLFADKIFLAPLLLDEVRSCWLVNMAAFEVSMAAGIQNPIVCSYLAVLAMLMDREDDAHRLRSKRLVQGELTNKETLDFFKALIKHISGGPLYINILEEIESYKSKRWIWIKVHKFVYRNFKTMVTVLSIALSIFAALVGLFKVLLFIKQH